MFQLTTEEDEILKSQIANSSWGGKRKLPSLRMKPNADCHDRLIVLDYGLPTEQAYHCGASSKDAGKKLCAINVILETSMIHPVIDKLLLASDRQI